MLAPKPPAGFSYILKPSSWFLNENLKARGKGRKLAWRELRMKTQRAQRSCTAVEAMCGGGDEDENI